MSFRDDFMSFFEVTAPKVKAKPGKSTGKPKPAWVKSFSVRVKISVTIILNEIYCTSILVPDFIADRCYPTCWLILYILYNFRPRLQTHPGVVSRHPREVSQKGASFPTVYSNQLAHAVQVQWMTWKWTTI